MDNARNGQAVSAFVIEGSGELAEKVIVKDDEEKNQVIYEGGDHVSENTAFKSE